MNLVFTLAAKQLWCRQSRWSACTLTGRPLAGHVVADYLGSLYLYDAVLEFLLARAGLSVDDESQVNHVHCKHATCTLPSSTHLWYPSHPGPDGRRCGLSWLWSHGRSGAKAMTQVVLPARTGPEAGHCMQLVTPSTSYKVPAEDRRH